MGSWLNHRRLLRSFLTLSAGFPPPDHFLSDNARPFLLERMSCIILLGGSKTRAQVEILQTVKRSLLSCPNPECVSLFYEFNSSNRMSLCSQTDSKHIFAGLISPETTIHRKRRITILKCLCGEYLFHPHLILWRSNYTFILNYHFVDKSIITLKRSNWRYSNPLNSLPLTLWEFTELLTSFKSTLNMCIFPRYLRNSAR